LIGGVTILIGAMLAFVQDDIKKVLAYSTISQLGYMVMALGVGAWSAAVFHLFTHAFFKALLFLGAGSISHAGTHHSFDMKEEMGGLRKPMPITFWTFMIGTLALAGIFPLAGSGRRTRSSATASQSDYKVFLVIGLIGAGLTAAYMTRSVYLTFFGEYRGHHHPHESEKTITIPLIVLAFLSIVAGFLNAAPFHIEKFTKWVDQVGPFPSSVHPELRLRARGVVGHPCGRRRSASWRTSGSSARRSARSRASRSATRSRTRATASSRRSTTSTTSTRT
jgi:NADH-quinone oxidoreductase subunit L